MAEHMTETHHDKWIGISIGVVAMIIATGLTIMFGLRCNVSENLAAQPRTVPQTGNIGVASKTIEIPNDAMRFCEDEGGGYIIYTAEDGTNQGLCVLEDTVCDADVLFEAGECPISEVTEE